MKKSSTYIPNDVAIYILSKLPLKFIKKFGCVCKSWPLLLEDSYFMDKIRNNFISNHYSSHKDSSLLFLFPQSAELESSFLFWLSGERFQNEVKLGPPKPFQYNEPIGIMGSASVNGILCLHDAYFYLIVMWNPATRDSKVIPRSPIDYAVPFHNLSSKLFGFGYDWVRDDYKLIREVYISKKFGYSLDKSLSHHFFEIYSLRSNSWRIVDDFDRLTFYGCRYYDHLYLDGMCHVLSLRYKKFEAYVMSFDLSNEVFFTTLCPSHESSHMYDDFNFYKVKRNLVMLNGFITFISYYADTLYISVLVEPGVKESWTKLFVFQHLSSCIQWPIGVGKMGDIFFRTKYNQVVRLGLSTHKLDMVIKDINVKRRIFDAQIVIYKESSLPTRGINH